MKRKITSAFNKATVQAADDKSVDSGLEDAMSTLEADFDYIMAGLEKLGRSGVNASNDALAIVENLSNDLKNYIAQIADNIAE